MLATRKVVFLFVYSLFGFASAIEKRIVNGVRVEEGDAPFVTSLQQLEDTEFSHFCTGTYLGAGFVLTASHCLKYIDICDIFVQIGQIQITRNGLRYQTIASCRKNFDPYTFVNDIAILKLNMSKDDPFYGVTPIEMPENYHLNIEKCKIYGFGATRYFGKYSEHLLTGNVEPITRNDCLSILGRVVTPDYHMGLFCARGYRGVDACGGDSGGGLFCQAENSSMLIGIVSYGVGCGSDAGVYTSVVHHGKWIKETMESLG